MDFISLQVVVEVVVANSPKKKVVVGGKKVIKVIVSYGRNYIESRNIF